MVAGAGLRGFREALDGLKGQLRRGHAAERRRPDLLRKEVLFRMRRVGFLLAAVLFLLPGVASASLVLGRGSVPAPDDPEFFNSHLNAALALKHLNGRRLEPGEVFSFNQAVGPRTEERGFLVGLSGVRGKYLPDVGGGVCRAATSLHRAVVRAGLEVVELHRHPGGADYAPEGDDAAVWWGRWDYRFRNDLPVTVVVYGRVAEDGSLAAEVAAPEFPAVSRGVVFLAGTDLAAVDGRPLRLEAGSFVEAGRCWVPLAAFCRLLGAAREAVAELVAVVERNGVSFVRVRPAAEALGLRVLWDPATRAVVIP